MSWSLAAGLPTSDDADDNPPRPESAVEIRCYQHDYVHTAAAYYASATCYLYSNDIRRMIYTRPPSRLSSAASAAYSVVEAAASYARPFVYGDASRVEENTDALSLR